MQQKHGYQILSMNGAVTLKTEGSKDQQRGGKNELKIESCHNCEVDNDDF